MFFFLTPAHGHAPQTYFYFKISLSRSLIVIPYIFTYFLTKINIFPLVFLMFKPIYFTGFLKIIHINLKGVNIISKNSLAVHLSTKTIFSDTAIITLLNVRLYISIAPKNATSEKRRISPLLFLSIIVKTANTHTIQYIPSSKALIYFL